MAINQTTDNSLIGLLEIDVPIIQGPFGAGLSSIDLLAEVSNAGGLGSFGAYHLTPEEIVELGKQIRERTDRSFNINLWVSMYDPAGKELSSADFDKYRKSFAPHYEELNIALPDQPNKFYNNFDEQIEALIEVNPKVFSFVFGVPKAEQLEKCQRAGIKTVGTATTVPEAVCLDQAGVDAVIATGMEAGGHRVSFLKTAEESLTGGLALIPSVVDAVSVPVIAAGGIADRRGVQAAFALGADAVQVGTAFLGCEESGTSARHRDVLFSEMANETVLTRAFSGRLARFIPNKLIRDVETDPVLPAPFPVQSYMVAPLKKAGLATGNDDYSSMYSSQCAALLQHRKTIDVMNELLKGL